MMRFGRRVARWWVTVVAVAAVCGAVAAVMVPWHGAPSAPPRVILVRGRVNR